MRSYPSRSETRYARMALRSKKSGGFLAERNLKWTMATTRNRATTRIGPRSNDFCSRLGQKLAQASWTKTASDPRRESDNACAPCGHPASEPILTCDSHHFGRLAHLPKGFHVMRTTQGHEVGTTLDLVHSNTELRTLPYLLAEEMIAREVPLKVTVVAVVLQSSHIGSSCNAEGTGGRRFKQTSGECGPQMRVQHVLAIWSRLDLSLLRHVFPQATIGESSL